LVALYLRHNLLKQCKGTSYEKQIASAFEKICSLLPETISIDFGELRQNISFELEPLRGDEEKVAACYVAIGKAMQEKKSLTILYHTISRDDTKLRTVDPYKLIYHQSAWYLLAYCHTRREVRIFALDRIKSVALSEETYTVRDDFSPEDYFKDAFQLFRGDAVQTVKIWFSPRQARYIKERVWHPSQEIQQMEDDSIILTLTVSGADRLKSWVMSFGCEARVIAPEDMAAEIVDELQKSLRSYQAQR
jgi:predicted DNA-binding transcriptional regulator YafY